MCILICVRAGAEEYSVKPCELRFEPVGGGSFIYCNNPEAISDKNLMNGSEPAYIMNNSELGPGVYYLYLSHFNYTGSGGAGTDIELDAELTPVSGECEYSLHSIGYETGKVTAWYENGKLIKYEQDWGMLGACAKAMGKTICDIDGEVCYPGNSDQKPVNVTADKTRWLSEFIPNYAPTHYLMPVHLQAVLEIKTGTMNVNVCAFKSSGTVGDRSGFRADAAYGNHVHDRCLKGVSPTLPQVRAELEYTIDDSVKDGDCLPVTMHNVYAPEGITRGGWYTNLNPLDDMWAKSAADSSGMIPFTYTDNGKLSFYGKNVIPADRNNIWYFDLGHSDAHEYDAKYGMKAENYIPNFPLLPEQNPHGYAVNTGNYGVTYTYDLTIANEGSRTRYFTYEPTTNSNIIAWTDTDGTESSYALSKKHYAAARTDIMSVVELPAGETVRFSVNEVLPVNYNGGTYNTFVIRDSAEKSNVETLEAKTSSRVYVKPINGRYLSEYRDRLPKNVLAEFDGKLDCYETIDCGEFYALRWCVWDGKPTYYSGNWQKCSEVYILNEDFERIGSHAFEALPCDMSYNDGSLYVKTAWGGIYSTENGSDWRIREGMSELPAHEAYKRIPKLTLGDILDADAAQKHTVMYHESREISGAEYEQFYRAVKDIELEYCENHRGGGYPEIDIDGLDIFAAAEGMSFSDENGTYHYIIADDSDCAFVYNLLLDMLYFGGNENFLGVSPWAEESVKTAAGYGFNPMYLKPGQRVIGYVRNKKYTEGIARIDFCKLIAEVINNCGERELPDAPEISFSDKMIWRAGDLKTAKQLAGLGIINGYEDGSFRPEAKITREEAAVILSRLLALYDMKDISDVSYADAASIQSWAVDGVRTTSEYGIMNGVGDNKFNPKGQYTVEQSIVTILRVFNTLTDSGRLKLPPFPGGGNRAVLYREGFRDNRVELAVFSTEPDSRVVDDNGILSVSGSYGRDSKYRLFCGRWLWFEDGYDRISNNGRFIMETEMGGDIS